MALFQSIEIDGFRNLEGVHIVPHPELNFIAGENGAGKTAILEAIHYLVRGKSFRSVQPLELMGRDVDQLLIRAKLLLEQDSGGQRIDTAVLRERNRRQQIRWRGKPAASFGQISSTVPLQLFLPSLSDLVFSGPGERRRWLDWGAFHVEHHYLAQWRRYSKCLQQRNALLKNGEAESSVSDSLEFQGFTEALVEAAQAVAEVRQSYLTHWLPFFQHRLRQLTEGRQSFEIPIVSYKPWGSSKSLSLRELLGESTAREVKSGVTAYGPHRADCDLQLGDLSVSSIVSRGQGKLIALAMMIGQADVIADRTGDTSVFLMDDLDAELDRESSDRLYGVLADCQAQVFITGVQPGPAKERTASGALPASYRMFHVKHGLVTEETA